MIRRLLAVGLVWTAAAFAGYTYDVGPVLGTGGGTGFQNNGTLNLGTGYTTPNTGSAIYTNTVSGTNPNDYEVFLSFYELRAGTYSGTPYTAYLFLRASSGTVMPGSGSYISVELVPSSSGPTQMNINQCVSGAITTLASTSVHTTATSTVRAVAWGTNLRVFIDGTDIWDMTIPATTGYPGIALSGAISYMDVAIGHHDTIVPLPVPSVPVGVSALPGSVSLQWPPATDDTNGIGMLRYQISRGGTFFGYAATPDFADSTVSPGTSYTYGIAAEDQHGNVNTPITVSVTTPPSGTPDPRRTGVRSTGSYWGGGGEQIDTLSGNLNYSLALVTPVSRLGRKYPLGLNYNLQNWRNGSSYNWQTGSDTGYGFGWKLQFGSITPYYASTWGAVDHYIFTDGTGADYRLDVNSSGIWSSSQSAYVWFDSTATSGGAGGRLHFSDGSFWVMGSISGGLEPDAGTMYPTEIEDSSGNDIGIIYAAATSLATGYAPTNPWNTSSRILAIENGNPATPGTTLNGTWGSYYFSWNSDTPVAHLTAIRNILQTPENYSFSYSSSALSPPFGTDPRYSGITTTLLSTVTVPITSNPYTFTYDTAHSGELLQVSFPYGGYLAWSYDTFTYVGGWSLREVAGRTLAADSAGATPWTYTISRNDSANPSPAVHANMTLVDASGIGAKTWNFYTSWTAPAPWQTGLLSTFVQLSASGGTVMRQDTYTWAQDPGNNAYIGSKLTSIDPTGSNPQTALVSQTLDQYGNTLTSTLYPYNNTSTPLRTYTNTYLNSSGYLSNFVFNRLTSSVLNLGGGVNKTLATNTYDGWSTLTASGAALNLDGGGVPVGSQGLLRQSVTPSVTTTNQYWDTGSPSHVTRSDGQSGTFSADAATNYSAPMSIATATYSASVTYTAWNGITSTTGANGEQLSMTYDSSGRPLTGTSAYGGVTHYSYSPATCPTAFVCPAAPALWQEENGPNGITVTTLDGLGRTVRVQRGDSTGRKSIVDTVYAPCACSPLAKLQKVSQPYTPGGTPVWTVYTYDGLGRTVSVVQPDGASTTATSYSGNQTTVTDPAGNWKQFTKDALGNLTTVVEPDPANQPGGALTTSYSYDWINHVSQVTMTRAGTTQTRSFVYSDAGLLTSATNPENGTVSYTYNSYNELATKTDAKGQVTQYTWNAPGQLAMAQLFPSGLSGAEDSCNRVTYTWGTDPSSYSYSRMTQVAIGTGSYLAGHGFYSTQYCPQLSSAGYTGSNSPYGSGYGPYFTDQYSYTPAGDVSGKTSTAVLQSGTILLSVGYGYDTYGRLSSTYYPLFTQPNTWNFDPDYYFAYYPVTFSISRDTMGRPVSMTSSYNDTNGNNYSNTWVQNGAYDYAGRLTSLQIANTTETRSYNLNSQLASLNWSTPSVANMTGGLAYTYSTTQNNGQITQMTDTLSGENVVYQYDSLKRLTSAVATPTSGSTSAAWSEQFGFDGFGNLTSKTLNSTVQTIAVNAASNRLSSAYYDLNGNMTSGAGATLAYDENNRLSSAAEVSGGTDYYMYAADGKRIWTWAVGGAEKYTFWGAHGEKIGVYGASIAYMPGGANLTLTTPVEVDVNFNGRPIWQGFYSATTGQCFSGTVTNAGVILPDRVGTNRSAASTSTTTAPAQFLPFGEEITSTSNDRVKFATYTRDSYTGLDYADQRFYASTYGRFNTPDAYGASAHLANPITFNRYMYVLGDPANRKDPSGRASCDGTDDGWDDNTYGCVDTSGGGSGCVGDDGFDDNGVPSCAYPGPSGNDVGGYGTTSTPPPDCNSLVAATGFTGLTYSNALMIWNDGNLNSYSTDSAAATIAALAAVTWQGESSFNRNPTNNPNYDPKTGALLSVDYGPFQINQHFHPNPNSAVWGTNGAGQTFNGSPDQNIAFGISILENLYSKFGNNAAGRYVGSLGTASAQKREATWNQYSSALTDLFSNTDCFPHP